MMKPSGHGTHPNRYNVSFTDGKAVRLLVVLVCSISILAAAGPEQERARKLYEATDYDSSLRLLQALPAKDAAAHALIGRCYYMQGEYKKAGEALERAFSADPQNVEYALWLGRSLGRRAETSSFVTAPGLASRARQYFEKAVQLNPRDVDALSDLFDYYLEAPGFLGGGFDKAKAVAAQIASVSAGDGYLAEAKLAERRKQYSTAEEQLRRAVEMAPQQVGRLIALAHFLTQQGRIPEAEQSLARAESIAPNSPRLLYARADFYVSTGRNLDRARDLLKRYLASSLTPDDPPRADAARLLRRAQGSS